MKSYKIKTNAIFLVSLYILAVHIICIALSILNTNLKSKYDALYDTHVESVSKLDDVTSRLVEANETIESYKHKLESATNILNDYQQSKNDLESKARYGLFKSYMDYRLFDERWAPYKLQQQATTDARGFRRIGEYYMIAIGKGWGLSVGDRMLVVLSNGKSFKTIMGDTKADVHTDAATHKVTLHDNSVIEFIVDKDKIINTIGKTGNIATLDEFKGAVIGIYKIG